MPGQRTAKGALARQAWVLSECSTSTPAELGRGAGGVPGSGIPRLQLSSVGGVADGSMPRVIQEAVLRRDRARRSRKQEAACLTRTVQLTH